MVRKRASKRQWLHFLTGDRHKESVALADRATGGAPSTEAVQEAEHVVKASHGDLGVDEARQVAAKPPESSVTEVQVPDSH